LLVANGFGGQEQPASTYRGGPGASFTAVWTGFGCASARTLIATDLDADGDPDLIATAIAGPVLVLRIDTPPANRLCVRLRGTRSNREGRGAVVTLAMGSGRRIARHAGAGGSVLGHGPVEACYGLGDDEPIAVEVRWPAGGLQTVPAVTGLMTITEP
jgi:hypothetical protein